jgi:hypothetical protein
MLTFIRLADNCYVPAMSTTNVGNVCDIRLDGCIDATADVGLGGCSIKKWQDTQKLEKESIRTSWWGQNEKVYCTAWDRRVR